VKEGKSVNTQGTSQPEDCIEYEFLVQGHLDKRWERWFDGLEITPLPSGETRLSGPVRDQAELHGILNRIRDLGVNLLSVRKK
jgi:hypothetical protein